MTNDINIGDMELLRLYDISIASKYGLPDQGNPVMYAKLAAMGLTEQKGNGYVITELGLATYKLNKHRLFGKKKREKKRKDKEFENDDYDSL